MGRIDLNTITDICADYSGAAYYVEELIPRNKLSNARESFPIPDRERVIAFVDATVFGSGKNGLAICSSGIYWHNDWTTHSANSFMDWVAFSEGNIRRIGMQNIELSPGNVFDMSGCSFRKDVLISLLLEIQDEVVAVLESEEDDYEDYELDYELDEEEEPDEDFDAYGFANVDDDWRVAIAGQVYGPYDLSIIQSMVQSKQIIPEDAHVWEPGMLDWVPFLEQPEMIDLLAKAAPAVPVIPATPVAPIVPNVAQTQGSFASADAIEALLEDGSDAEPIDVNKATWDRLIDLPCVGAADAKKIVQMREANGGFRSAEQVGELLGLKPHQVEKLRQRAVFATAGTPSSSPSPSPSSSKRSSVRMVDY